MRRTAGLFLVTVAFAFILSACGNTASPPGRGEPKLAPESALPGFARDAPPQVKEAYRFAIANPDALKQYPCYCGCDAVGHKSNLDCYVKEVRPDGSIVFDEHAFG
jgi:predicted small secreted protein